MYCKKCGNLLEVTDTFCKNCGEPVAAETDAMAATPPVTPTTEPTNENLGASFAPQPEPAAPAPEPVVPTEPVTPTVEPVGVEPQVASTVPPVTPAAPAAPTPAPAAPAGNNNFKIIVIILIIAVVGVGGFIAYKVLNNKVTPTEPSTPTESTNPSTIDNPTGNTGDVYKFKDYELRLPTGYQATVEDEQLHLVNYTDLTEAFFDIYDYVTVEDVTDAIDDLKKSLTEYGWTVGTVENKQYNGIDFVLIHMSAEHEGKKIEAVDAYGNFGEYHLAQIFLYNFGTKSNDAVLTEFANMFASATYKGTKQFSAGEAEGTVGSTAAKAPTAATVTSE